MFYLKIETEKNGQIKTHEYPAGFETEESDNEYIKSLIRLFPKKHEASRFSISVRTKAIGKKFRFKFETIRQKAEYDQSGRGETSSFFYQSYHLY